MPLPKDRRLISRRLETARKALLGELQVRLRANSGMRVADDVHDASAFGVSASEARGAGRRAELRYAEVREQRASGDHGVNVRRAWQSVRARPAEIGSTGAGASDDLFAYVVDDDEKDVHALAFIAQNAT